MTLTLTYPYRKHPPSFNALQKIFSQKIPFFTLKSAENHSKSAKNMNFYAVETAVFPLKSTGDPLYSDAIRTLSVQKFVEFGWISYLTLFRNSAKHVEYEPREPFIRPD